MGIAWIALLTRLALLVCIVTMGRSINFGIRRKIKRSANDERLKAAMSFLSALRIPHSLFILPSCAHGVFYPIITCSQAVHHIVNKGAEIVAACIIILFL